MAKMGRPKSDDPMNYRFTIRFSNAEQKQLESGLTELKARDTSCPKGKKVELGRIKTIGI